MSALPGDIAGGRLGVHPTRTSASAALARGRRGARLLSGVPLWTGRVLQLVAVTMLVIAFSDVVLPEGVYWATSYFAVLGLSPEPFVFNAVLLFVVGSAAKRRLRGAMLFLILFELPTVLMPVVNLISVGPRNATFFAEGGTADLVAAAVAVGFIALLIAARREFSARAEPASYRRALAVFVCGVAVAVVVGGLLSQYADPSISVSDGWWWSLHAATGIYPSDWLLDGSADRLSTGVELAVTSLSASALLLALWVLLRSARQRRLVTEVEELGVRRILRTSRSEDSLAYFATRRDKSVVFSTDRRAAVSYRVVNGVALASGDPLGPEGAWVAATEEWLKVVQGYGWRPAVLAATERGADHYARYGMRGVSLGDEALLHVDGARRDAVLRSPHIDAARRRARRAGYTVKIRRQRDLAPEALERIEALAELWRGAESERGFSMALSRMGDPSDGDSLIVTAHDGSDEIMALLVFVPWNGDGISLDVMRRSPNAVNGTTEFLVATLLAEAETLGLRRISLNFAVLRDVLVRGARVGAGPLLRAKRRILLLLSRRWQLESLRRANEKYEPDWRPRFLMWSRHTSLGGVMLAVARVEGFAGSAGSRRAGAGTPRSAAFLKALAAERARTEPRDGSAAPLSPRAAEVLAMRAGGEEPYPAVVPRTHALAELRAHLSGRASVTGRIIGRRRHGGIAFLDLIENHTPFQVIATAHDTAGYEALRHARLGDIVSVTGEATLSDTGEPSLLAESWVTASKSLRQPPDRRMGLTDPEAQVRQRHVHLASSDEAAGLLRARSRAVRALRDRLVDESYMEVETPILQRIHGGANARPFRTHINAYHRDLSLRIAPELALKRLIVAGFPQVFEIGRNFRNEGVDSTHNPEFTAMEAYRAFADYTDMRELAERLVKDMVVAAAGSPTLLTADGTRVDVSGSWRVVTVCDALTERIGVPISIDLELGVLRELCAVYRVSVTDEDTAGTLRERLHEELVEPETVLPTFYTDFPSDTSPLARPHRRIEGLSERWDLVALGMELGTAYSELVDPIEQRRRLTAQSLRAAGGDPEAMELDEDFLAALEFGMPPTGGLGLGVDRIVMAATGATIRQTLAFPFVR